MPLTRMQRKAMATIARLGGLARSARMTPAERRQSARIAALARWARRGQKRISK